jgi:phosphoribosylanthranilate isomerase
MHAVGEGADAIGLNCYELSSRYISIEKAAQIAHALPAFVSSVAVMVNPDRRLVESIITTIKPDLLQFHGNESAEFCNGFGFPYIRAIRVSDTTEILALEKTYSGARAIMLDTFSGDKYGGTGKVFDWGKASYGGTKPVILAGGLVPGNVADAIETARPFCVDVSSGVETDGVKDKEKISRFCRTVLES